MSQLRKDIITGDWVIFAANRRKKPYQFAKKAIINAVSSEDCSFCPGHEDETPDKIYQNGDDGKWSIRVFRNLYPAVDTQSYEKNDDEFYTSEIGLGIHEILVDTPNHFDTPEDFSTEHITEILTVLQTRFKTIQEEEFIKYVQIFKNNGPEAGASIAHSHWQTMGVSVVPIEQEKAIRNFKNYRKKNGKCLMCEMNAHEIENKERMVAENKTFVSFVPYAAKLGFEIMVVPKRHVASFEDVSQNELNDLAKMFGDIFKRLKTLRNDVSYNLCFQEKPKDCGEQDFHWYMRILPRIGAPAGFEFATGCYINPILPEESALKYRNFENWNK